MKTFQDLNPLERIEVIDRARSFYHRHELSILECLASDKDTTSYAPSGYDMISPSLWKNAHWRWFKEWTTRTQRYQEFDV